MPRWTPFVMAGLAGLGLIPALPGSAPGPQGVATLAGTVRDSAGSPLPGASVLVAGTAFRATTGRDGGYRIAGLPAGAHQVTARAIGHRAVHRTVRLLEGSTVTADFVLLPDAFQLDDLSVTGRGRVEWDKSASPPVAAAELGQVRGGWTPPIAHRHAPFNTEEYAHRVDNGWRSPREAPLSTFSADVDAGSYANVRRFLAEGRLPPADAVRVEEMINYFRYDYPAPRDEHPFAVTTEVGSAPWNPGHRLALIGLQARRLQVEQLPPSNLVFLVDVSGSMNDPRKLPLVKGAFRLLVDQLRPRDRVAIVVYAGAAGLVLPSTPGSRKDLILDALERLQAGGSTAGAAGIRLAYRTAREHFLRDGNNRVILATDGDFNVGVSSEGELVRMVEEERRDGIFLTVLGFGTGNLKDAKMEQLADKGNGHYAYVDNLLEAKKVLVQELGATLLTVAKDVKLQVEFNPATVQAYRLVGYENRLLAAEDFNDDTKDAGEMGAGHSVTALYEIVPVGSPLDVPVGRVDPLRYQPGPGGVRGSGEEPGEGDWFTVKFRYKLPERETSRLLSRAVRGESRHPSTDFRWASAVAGVAMLLRDSEHRGSATWPGMLALARGARGADAEGHRAEFLRLVEMMELLARRERGEAVDR